MALARSRQVASCGSPRPAPLSWTVVRLSPNCHFSVGNRYQPVIILPPACRPTIVNPSFRPSGICGQPGQVARLLLDNPSPPRENVPQRCPNIRPAAGLGPLPCGISHVGSAVRTKCGGLASDFFTRQARGLAKQFQGTTRATSAERTVGLVALHISATGHSPGSPHA